MYLSIRKAIKQTVVIIGHITFDSYVQNVIQNAVQFNFIRRGKYRDHQCEFRRNRSTTDHIFCNCQILEKKWEYKEAVQQIFIDFKKVYDSVRREV